MLSFASHLALFSLAIRAAFATSSVTLTASLPPSTALQASEPTSSTRTTITLPLPRALRFLNDPFTSLPSLPDPPFITSTQSIIPSASSASLLHHNIRKRVMPSQDPPLPAAQQRNPPSPASSSNTNPSLPNVYCAKPNFFRGLAPVNAKSCASTLAIIRSRPGYTKKLHWYGKGASWHDRDKQCFIEVRPINGLRKNAPAMEPIWEEREGDMEGSGRAEGLRERVVAQGYFSPRDAVRNAEVVLRSCDEEYGWGGGTRVWSFEMADGEGGSAEGFWVRVYGVAEGGGGERVSQAGSEGES